MSIILDDFIVLKREACDIGGSHMGAFSLVIILGDICTFCSLHGIYEKIWTDCFSLGVPSRRTFGAINP